ncbi:MULTISPECIES: allantoate deiminase [Yersinia]|uniref:Allantoate deiminase n=1 Tax=Yersinia intermedia TaxID=631 RepID=A0ABX6F9R3_YERIN|nr:MULTISPECIES: allantoate deiminase [Yersinia]AJJ20646.1 allantoate amidohydrolase [Yersinia intermedia]ARB84700.1 allantoate amidohydrolase [Yersinia sp. FDAARGOS_228]AVL34483.1 allantoate amidohydrolase [Yersinia intermedia]MCB5299463.1 allantoate deiminase [Yersinia intermedia]MCW8113722.1 allantoate deiminase [Yersinia intermedia]
MKRFEQEITASSQWLSAFGADPSGGMTRLLYSPEWVAAQKALKTAFETAGLTAHFDGIGNLSGQLKGSKYPDEIIMSGSHIDTVVNGGNLDGQWGIEAAFIAINYLHATYGKPLRTLEVISLAEEEGSRFPYVFWGSKNVLGQAKKTDVATLSDANGINFIDAMHDAGFTVTDECQPPRRDIAAFVELHIEQGKVLETEGQTIGVVTSIVGQRRYDVTLIGEANHAGTTPMSYRKDTVEAFSRICCESLAKARAEGDPLVLTFGKVTPRPNTVNVVPGMTQFTIDCRHTDSQVLQRFTHQLEADIYRICDEMSIKAEIDLWMDEAPIPMDPTLVNGVTQLCKTHQFNARLMHSGAGHDSQIFAPQVPTVMLFVPSIDGISHNPAERTATSDLCEGVKILAHTLYQLAYLEQPDWH